MLIVMSANVTAKRENDALQRQVNNVIMRGIGLTQGRHGVSWTRIYWTPLLLIGTTKTSF
jgi:hypothetical protein